MCPDQAGSLQIVEWVLVSVVDDVDAARAELSYLRSRDILGRVVDEGRAFHVEVRAGDADRARSLSAARARVRDSRLPAQQPGRNRSLARWGVALMVVASLLLAAFPVVVFLWVIGLDIGIHAGTIGGMVFVIAFIVFSVMSIRSSDKAPRKWGDRSSDAGRNSSEW